MTKVNIAKNYSRKLSLKEIIGRYDNIECGTIVTLSVNVESEEDLNKALRIVGKKVLKDTERELAEALALLKETKDDPSNSALVGEGTSISNSSRKSSSVDGMNDLLSEAGISEGNIDDE